MTNTSAHPPRVASLLPSATEIVCALGLADALVGVSHECDFPAEVAGKRVLTMTKIRPAPRSGDIDRDVRTLLRDALAVYDIDLAALAEAAPDVIVTQDLCDVCAVSFEDVKNAARALANPALRIVNLHPTRLLDIWADVRAVASALGREREGEDVLGALDRRVAAVADRAARIAERPATLTIEWIDPVMIGGTWMPELVALAGGSALVSAPGQHAPTLSQAELAALDPAPEVVVIKPCGFALARTRSEAAALRALLATFDWPAVQAGRVYVADGNAYFNRPGPRIVDSLEILAACIHPAAFADLGARHRRGFESFTL